MYFFRKHIHHNLNNQQGTAIIVTIMVLILLSIIGTAALNSTNNELLIARNTKLKTESFYDSEAGINFALATMENKIQNGTFSLPDEINTGNILDASIPPKDFFFSISKIYKISNELYRFNSTGYDSINSSNTIIEATFESEPESVINFAGFGNSKLDTKDSGNTVSYNSNSSDPNVNDPTSPSFTSTNEAHIGSNEWLMTHNGTYVDGDLVLGKFEDGTNATNNIDNQTIYTGDIVNQSRIDPDPLGIDSGEKYDPSLFSSENDNTNSTLYESSDNSTLGSTNLTIDSNNSLTLKGKSGGANFYFTSIALKNNSHLYIDATNGPVNIYLTGSFEAKNGANIEVLEGSDQSYDATKFNIFSNSIDDITLKNSSDFTGFIYAPLADDIEIHNTGNVYGAIWGDAVDIKNSGNLFYDTALQNHESDRYRDLILKSWMEK